MVKRLAIFVFCALWGVCAAAADDLPHYPIHAPQKQQWSFSGPFGTYDKGQLQRGLKIYHEVCSACHGLKYVHFRDLAPLGYSEDEIKAFAAQFTIADGPDDEGEMFDRPGRLNDAFPNPFANEKLAAFANNGTVPVDLSLIARARAVPDPALGFISDLLTGYTTAGPDYIYAYLTGYQEPPEGREVAELNYYNPYFISGDTTNMAPPLTDGMVAYAGHAQEQGAPETVEQYARDISAFLMWAADPHMEARKQLGMQVMLFLLVFAVLVFFLKRSFFKDFDEED